MSRQRIYVMQCHLTDLTADAQLTDMSEGEPTVKAGAADAWLLPPHPSTHCRARAA